MSFGHADEKTRTLEARPDATPEQWASATRLPHERAPDLVEMVLGEAAA